jgi:pimeloyl-ACP methyl ester carboxylesterase
MPEVFSIYNCGTSYNRQNLDETVADLARRTVGAENRDWMINDGPGSYSHHVGKSATALVRGLAAQAKTPGTRDPISGLKEGSAFAVIRGVVSGYGWEHNVDHTMAVLNATLDLPRTINLVGWSRGAITCFMIAHALNENPRTKPIAVNICAFDPVPGPGNFHDPEKVTLPANVKKYVAIVEQDERRKIFKPVLIDEDDSPGMKTRFYYMPGGHGTGVFRSKNEVGLIATFLVHRFLQKHGTRLNNPIGLTRRDLCELYAKVRLNMAEYEKSGGGILLLLGKQRRTLPNRFQDTGYFINDHHASQFRKTFPQVWSALEHGVNAARQRAFESVLVALKNSAPTTYLSLEKVGILS